MAKKQRNYLIFFIFVALAFACYKLKPPSYIYGILALAYSAYQAINFLKTRWVESEPNEWLLIIQNGKLVKSGIGLKSFLWPFQQIVKFPSQINKVVFQATNVTQEMQGIKISGFAIWSVNREGEGPFKCYKYTQGGNANSYIETLCESIIRHQIANHKLKDVLTNREILRQAMKEDLQKQLNGWGVWLETVEITDVRICSKRLFDDMQAEFRQETHLNAEQIKMSTDSKVLENQQNQDFNQRKNQLQNETEKLKYDNEQKIKRMKENQEYFKHQNKLEKEKIKQDLEFQLKSQTQKFEIDKEKLEKEQELDQKKKDFEINKLKQKLEIDKKYTPLMVKKYMIDSTERIYNNLPLKQIAINQYVQPDKTTNVSCLLPGVGMIMQQNQDELKDQ